MKTLKIAIVLLLCTTFLATTAEAQCNIHSNFKAYADASGLKNKYTVKVTIISAGTGSRDYTAYGVGEFCNTKFQSGCKSVATTSLYFSDRKAQGGHPFHTQKRDKQTMTIDFVNNTVTFRLDSWGGAKIVHRNIRRVGNNFYVIKGDGQIISFKLVKGTNCLI